MNGSNVKQVWLVDSDEYLARLLAIRLAPHRIQVKQVHPAGLAAQPPSRAARPPGRGLVILSLPQPGCSSPQLTARAKDCFPGSPLVLLLPPGHSPGSLGVAQGLALPHRFSKPLKDIDAFLNLVVSTVARPEETPRQPQARL